MLLRIKGDKARKQLAPNPIPSVYPHHDSRNSFLWAGHHARGWAQVNGSLWLGTPIPFQMRKHFREVEEVKFQSMSQGQRGCFCDEPSGRSPQPIGAQRPGPGANSRSGGRVGQKLFWPRVTGSPICILCLQESPTRLQPRCPVNGPRPRPPRSGHRGPRPMCLRCF